MIFETWWNRYVMRHNLENIIDEVHMLSQAAFNAFLKTLEEPPSYAIFILATTEKHKIIPTILSRCQIFDFNRIQVKDITKHLIEIADKETIKYEEEALHLIAQKADGALRDALSIFDLIVTYSLGHAITYKATIDNLHILDYEYYFKITDAILQEKPNQLLLYFDEILAKGFDGHNFIVGLSEHFRNLMVCKDEITLKLLEVSDSAKQKYREQATHASASVLMSALSITNHCDTQYKSSKNTRLHVELALMKMAYLNQAIQLARSADELKKKANTEPVNAATENVAEKKNDIKTSAPVKSTFKLPTLESLAEKIEQKAPEPLQQNIAKATLIQDEKPLDFKSVQQAWQSLSEIKQAQGKTTEHIILNNRKIELKDVTVRFSVENAFLFDYLNVFKTEIIEYLREKTSCSNLFLDYWIEKKEENERKAYTPSEKYQYLVQKFPSLNELRLKLGLELEY
jgi:DNA polymerase III subunit gamma/tau